MRLIKPCQILKYSKCPKRSLMSWDAQEPPMSFEHTVITNIIKCAHMYRTQKGRPAWWRWIRSFAERYYQDAMVDPAVPQPTEYKTYVSLLQSMYPWYQKIYHIEYPDEAIVNIPIWLQLGSDCVYNDTIPLIILGKEITIIDFKEVDRAEEASTISLYNDLTAHVRMWGFKQAAQVNPTRYARLFLHGQYITHQSIRITQNTLENASKICKHILTGMKEKVFYPSFSEQCINCPFNQGCTI